MNPTCTTGAGIMLGFRVPPPAIFLRYVGYRLQLKWDCDWAVLVLLLGLTPGGSWLESLASPLRVRLNKEQWSQVAAREVEVSY